MSDDVQALGRLIRFGSAFTLVGVAGFALAACGGGGGSALTTRSSVTATRPAGTVTETAPTRTRTVAAPATTEATPTAAETTTVALTTTAPGPTTTRPIVIVTTQTQPTTAPVTTESESTTETQATTAPLTTAPATTAGEASSSSTPWGWIILGAALLAALVIGIIVWRRSRAGSAAWSAQSADLTRRSLLAMDDVLREGSVVTGQIQALAAEAQSLEKRAPDDSSRAAAALRGARLDELARTLEADRTLRLSSPPPSEEQLAYSTALIRQQVEQLQGVLRPPTGGQSPTDS